MLRYTHPFPLYINPNDPASEVIAMDLRALGGIPSATVALLYGFSSGRKREDAMKQLRGVYGCKSVASAPSGWNECPCGP